MILFLAGAMTALSQEVGVTNALPVNTPHQEMSAARRGLLAQLRKARRGHDGAQKDSLERVLDRMSGSITVPMQQEPGIRAVPPAGNALSRVASTSPITSGGFWAIATATEPSTGRLWAAGTRYGATGDTVQFFYSDNGGQTWTGYMNVFYTTTTVHYKPGELDIEVVEDTTNTWLFTVMGGTDGAGRQFSDVFRFNTTNFSFFSSRLNFPFADSVRNATYNPRITSDNSVYDIATYLYITASSDSTITDSVHNLTQKFAVIRGPFAPSPGISYVQANATGGGFFWHAPSVPRNTYLYNDIAYYASADTDRIMTVFSCMPFQNLYLAWSDDYGTTNAGYLTIPETNLVKGARLAFNGGINNLNGMLVYNWLFSGNDWDTYYRNTTTGGTKLTSWIRGPIDPSGYVSRSCDLVAIPLAPNLFKAAYNLSDSSMYAGFNGSTWNSPAPMKVTTVPPDTMYGTIRAGYRVGSITDGFAVWSAFNGTNLYGAYNFMTAPNLVGGAGPGTPWTYRLDQNYPNPFNPSTTIHYELARAGRVLLKIYNVLGQEVATLVDGEVAAGTHEARWVAGSVASGVYFYKLQAGSFTTARKLIVLK